MSKLKVTFPALAKMIDHSLLHPTMTDKDIDDGIKVALRYETASACVKPYSVKRAASLLKGSSVKTCAVIGFPHGNSTTDIVMRSSLSL
jgi:deoxyribose-phosphate aldolase